MQFTMERVVANRCSCLNPLASFSSPVPVQLRQVSSCCPAPAPCVSTSSASDSTRRRQLVVPFAYAPSLPSMVSARPSLDPQARQSLDPQQKEWEQAWEPGRLITVKSREQFEGLLSQHPNKLVVLMCKSHACRPCKMFTRKYLAIVSATLSVHAAALGAQPKLAPWGPSGRTHCISWHFAAALPRTVCHVVRLA